jgi:hypothetical protein
MDAMTGTTMTKVLIGLTKEHIAALDEWRRQQADLPNRSEAVRRILDAHLFAGRSARPKVSLGRKPSKKG